MRNIIYKIFSTLVLCLCLLAPFAMLFSFLVGNILAGFVWASVGVGLSFALLHKESQ